MSARAIAAGRSAGHAPSCSARIRALSVVALALAAGSGATAVWGFPPPMPLAERVRGAEIVLHVMLKRVIILDDRNPKQIRARAHVQVIEVLKGRLSEKMPTIDLTIVSGSEEGDLVAPPKPGRYVLLLNRGREGALRLFSPNVYGWMGASDATIRKVKLQALPGLP